MITFKGVNKVYTITENEKQHGTIGSLTQRLNKENEIRERYKGKQHINVFQTQTPNENAVQTDYFVASKNEGQMLNCISALDILLMVYKIENNIPYDAPKKLEELITKTKNEARKFFLQYGKND